MTTLRRIFLPGLLLTAAACSHGPSPAEPPLEDAYEAYRNDRHTYEIERRNNASAEAVVDSRWDMYTDDVDGRLAFEARVDTVGARWENVGRHVSGRILSHAFDPQDSRTLWIGSTGGGLWQSTDGGARWRPMTDHLPSLSIATVAVHPNDSRTLLIGAGSDFHSFGVGVLKSTDGGRSWYTTNLFQRFSDLAVRQLVWDPVDTRRVYMSSNLGLWTSDDEGRTWTPVRLRGDVQSLALNPRSPDTLYAATGPLTDDDAGIYRSSDRGTTWNLVASWRTLNDDAPLTANDCTTWFMCAQLALVAEQPQTLYVVVQDSTNASAVDSTGRRNIGALYRSDDGGDTWRPVPTNVPAIRPEHRLWLVKVAPDDPDRVFVGGIELFRTTDGGRHWEKAGRLTEPDPLYTFTLPPHDARAIQRIDETTPCTPETAEPPEDEPGGAGRPLRLIPPRLVHLAHDPQAQAMIDVGSWIHVDQQDFAFHPDDPSVVFAFNDGGVYRSDDGGTCWTASSEGLMTLQFYALADAPTDTNRVAAAAQDQGLLLLWDEPDGRHRWLKWNLGDGVRTLFDPTAADVLYGTAAGGNHWRFTIPTDSLTMVSTTNKHRIQGTFPYNIPLTSGLFVTPLVMHPHDPRVLYTASTEHIYKTEDGGERWHPVLDARDASLLAVDQADPRIVYAYARTSNNTPGLWRSTNGGDDWTLLSFDASNAWPGSHVSNLDTDPDVAGALYAVRSTFGEQVWQSTDEGQTWTNITHNLPKVPVNAIAVTPRAVSLPRQLYLGTDTGVFMAYEGELVWRRIHGALPHVEVKDLHIHPVDKTVRVGTFGRGYWKMKVASVTRTVDVAPD